MRGALSIVVTGLLLVTLPSTTKAYRAPQARKLVVERVHLRSGGSVAFALHPSARPVVLRSTEPGLEVCRGLPHENENAEPGCIRFDDGGRAELHDGDGLSHLSYFIRTRDRSSAKIERLTLEYEAIDDFFFWFSPPVPHGLDRTRLTVTPHQSRTVGVVAYRDRSQAATPIVIRVAQGGHALSPRRPPANDPSDFPAFRYRARQGRPVLISLRNPTQRAESVVLSIVWS